MKYVIANYKKRFTLRETLKNIREIDKYNNLIVLPDSNFIKDISVKNIKIGVQDAFISDNILDMVNYIMIGHPDYKKINNETPEVINKFLKEVSKENIIMLNVNSIDELTKCLDGITSFNNIYVLFELEKHIGTSNILDVEEIEKFAVEARKLTNNESLIFYGGGIKVNNVDLLHKTSIDGILVGAASLDNKDLEQIMFRWTVV